MQSTARGDVYFPDRYTQLRDYSGLLFGNITPTDIDGLIEYKNKGYVILELKCVGQIVPSGQLVALERLHDDLVRAGKQVLCIIAEHDTELSDKIDAAQAVVKSYRYFQGWEQPKEIITVGVLVGRFLRYLD